MTEQALQRHTGAGVAQRAAFHERLRAERAEMEAHGGAIIPAKLIVCGNEYSTCMNGSFSLLCGGFPVRGVQTTKGHDFFGVVEVGVTSHPASRVSGKAWTQGLFPALKKC
eukprot:1465784-Prymnesium_polylepis.1